MDFSFDDFVKDLPPPVTEALVNEAFTTLPSLQAATQDDIESTPEARAYRSPSGCRISFEKH